MTITLDKAIDLVRLVCIPDLQVAFEKYMIEFEPRDYSSPVTGTILRQFRSQFINLPWRLTNENVADLRQRWRRLVAGTKRGTCALSAPPPRDYRWATL